MRTGLPWIHGSSDLGFEPEQGALDHEAGVTLEPLFVARATTYFVILL